jgi:hypothetical protein
MESPPDSGYENLTYSSQGDHYVAEIEGGASQKPSAKLASSSGYLNYKRLYHPATDQPFGVSIGYETTDPFPNNSTEIGFVVGRCICVIPY